MSFSFGFSGDDIEEDPNDAATQSHAQATVQASGPAPLPAQTHDLEEMVCTAVLSRSYLFQIPPDPGTTISSPSKENHVT
jgi:protein-histidine N-methyltransferase